MFAFSLVRMEKKIDTDTYFCTRDLFNRIYNDLYFHDIPDKILRDLPENKIYIEDMLNYLFDHSWNRNRTDDELKRFLDPDVILFWIDRQKLIATGQLDHLL